AVCPRRATGPRGICSRKRGGLASWGFLYSRPHAERGNEDYWRRLPHKLLYDFRLTLVKAHGCQQLHLAAAFANFRFGVEFQRPLTVDTIRALGDRFDLVGDCGAKP